MPSPPPTLGIIPAPEQAKNYFKWWNRTNDGKLIFNDFLHGITIHVQDEEKRKKKALKKLKRSKKKASVKK